MFKAPRYVLYDDVLYEVPLHTVFLSSSIMCTSPIVSTTSTVIISHWEQWYYHQLQPFKHFIPLSSLHPKDILKAYRYCERSRWKDRIANSDADTDGCDDDDDSDGCDADVCSGKISGIQSCSSRNADMDRSTEGMVNDICEEIADAASAFVRKLTYEYAVKHYEIH